MVVLQLWCHRSQPGYSSYIHTGYFLGATVFSMGIGEAVGPVLAGRIFDVTHNYNPAFLICAILSIGAGIIVLFLEPTKPCVADL